ncbi:Bud-site selection protein [Dipodascopsis tothii]|uniref:Bud-site selection protein n=1 Tax=Dipodascopsis tothii TaxID=44089 RepID=UPI0034D01AF7
MAPKRKRENLLQELDILEHQALGKKTRLVKTEKMLASKAGKKSDEIKAAAVPADDGKVAERVTELKRKLVENKIFFYEKSLGRAVKKAKTFEVQKLVRKIKDSRTAGKDVAKLEKELEVLKGLDHADVAKTGLQKRLSKNPRLAGVVAKPAKGDADDSVRSDAVSKVMRAKAVQTALKDALDGVSVILSVADGARKQQSRRALAAKARARDGDDADTESGDESDDADDAGSDAEAGSDAAAGSDVDSDELAEMDAMVAGSSDESDGETPQWPAAGDVSLSEAESEPEPAPKPKKAKESKTKVPKAVAKDPKKTIVLPSLNVGYISPTELTSDEDLSDTGALQAKPRKNRRGQRARQKIWEQKYGKNAAHVKKQKAEEAREQRERQERQIIRQQRQERRTALAQIEKEQQDEDRKRRQKAFDSTAMHPSWVAKQQAQKPVAFKGKKIVFD